MDAWLLSWKQAVNKVDPYAVLAEVLTAHHVDIIELNQQQLDQGIKSTGDRLTPYTAPYEKWRKKRGLKTSNPDFKVTGDFHDAIYANPSRLYTMVGSRDFKEKYLEKRDGTEIFSLTPENIDSLLWERGVADDFITLYTTKLLAA